MSTIPVIQQKRFEQMDEFIRSISYGGELYHIFERGKFVFRGHSTEKYALVPSALRPQTKDWFRKIALSSRDANVDDLEWIQMTNEYNLLRRFYKSCDSRGLVIPNIDRIRDTFHEKLDMDTMFRSEYWLPKDLWEIAALAQHYGVPTRLLDWSHDMYTALYFSIEDQLEGKSLPDGTMHIVLWALNIDPIVTYPNFALPLCIVQPIYYGNPNLSAQQGMFTLWQREKIVRMEGREVKIDTVTKTNRKPLDELLQEYGATNGKHSEPYLYKIILPFKEGRILYQFLHGIGYDASRIYPGYYGATKAVMHEHYLYDDVLDKGGAISLAT